MACITHRTFHHILYSYPVFLKSKENNRHFFADWIKYKYQIKKINTKCLTAEFVRIQLALQGSKQWLVVSKNRPEIKRRNFHFI